MDWFQASDYWLSRFIFGRALAAVYFIALLVTVNQFPALLGERGLLPVSRFVRIVPLRHAPSLFHFAYSDRLLRVVSWVGIVLAASLVVGLPQQGPAWLLMLVWLALWSMYLSIVNVGQTFYAFGWETLLLEAGAIAIFLGPDRVAPPVTVMWLVRWLLFRVEFGAGLIKIRGDPCWRDLTCLFYHHETQPMPNPLSWYFHHLPQLVHRVEVLGNHVGQLVAPFALFAPQPVASAAALVMIVHQLWLILSGNFSWLNALTMTLAFAVVGDGWWQLVLPFGHGALQPLAPWSAGLTLAFTLLVVVLSYWPVRNLLSRRQLMNASFDPFHLVNTYGAFGSITRARYEIVIEGSTDREVGPGTVWREYEFKGKPGDVRRRPPQIAPYHLRLDWLMWFAAMSTPLAHPWILALIEKLLENDGPTLRLLRRNPFPDRPPAFVRALLYHYRFTTWRERKETGAWWLRTRVGAYLPPLSLSPAVDERLGVEDVVPERQVLDPDTGA